MTLISELACFRGLFAEHSVGEGGGGFGLHAGEDVLIDGHGEGDAGVAEAFADDLSRVNAFSWSRIVAWVWRRSCSRMRG